MSASRIVMLVMLAVAIACAVAAWRVPTPYGGDAGLADALSKLLGYGVALVLVLIVAIWFAIQQLF